MHQYIKKVSTNSLLICLFLVGSSCASSENKTNKKVIDENVANVFTKPPIMMKDLMFASLLRQREAACSTSPNSCSDLSTLAPALCNPVDHAHWDWLPTAWGSIFKTLNTESEAQNIFKQLQKCVPSATAGQLIATLELVKVSYNKKWRALSDEVLPWLKTHWITQPDHIDVVLVQIADTLNSLSQQGARPNSALTSISLLSISWMPRHQIQSLTTESLMQWSMALAKILPETGNGVLFNRYFSHLIPRILKVGHLSWAMDVASAMCFSNTSNKPLSAPCIKAFQQIHSESSTRPDIQLQIDYIFFEEKLPKLKDIKNTSEQIDVFARRAQKWLPTLVPSIYKNAAEFFSKNQEKAKAQAYMNLYLDAIKKGTSH